MAYSPENNPYIPGDPYSYDLKWMVDKINGWKDPLDSADRAKASEEAAAASAETADLKAQAAANSANQAANSANQAATYADNIADPVSGIVTDWLDDHITQPTTPPLDTSLTVAGAAADAKAAGDAIQLVNDEMFLARRRAKKIVDISTPFTSNNIQTESGFHSYTNFKSTDYIDISEYKGREFIFTLFGFNRVVGGLPVQVDSVAIYDNAQNVIRTAYIPQTTTSAGARYTSTIAIPTNAKYARFVYNSTQTFDPEVYVADNGVIRLRIACVGDSLTQGLYQNLGGGSYVFVSQPYPDIMENVIQNNHLYFAEVLNYGRRGLSPITYWNGAIPENGQYNSPAAGEPGDPIVFDPSINVAVIMLGTNGNLTNDTIAQDTAIGPGQTYLDYANTHCGDYCKIIEYIQEHTNNNCSIILAVPPYCDDSTYHDKIMNSIHTIEALGERYSLPVINPFYEAGINAFNKDDFFWTSDYIHMTQRGYRKLGRYITQRVISFMDPLENI